MKRKAASHPDTAQELQNNATIYSLNTKTVKNVTMLKHLKINIKKKILMLFNMFFASTSAFSGKFFGKKQWLPHSHTGKPPCQNLYGKSWGHSMTNILHMFNKI